ncbi:MAG TPA: rod shape-determining protein MreC [Gemmatimonadales bacterium]|nr:rod shape-determining protein MreC [Gemmatimonadales bacterium]
MTIGAERYGSRADTVAFVACLVVALVTLALPEALRAPIAAAMRRSVLLPAVTLESRVAASRAQRQAVLVLRAERDSFALAASQVPELVTEIAELRALLRLRARLGSGFVTAEVLHQSGLTDGLTLLLSAGRRAGVTPLAPVVSPTGLVGMVTTVDPRSSVVMAWSHPDFRASAMTARGRVFGIVSARRGERAGEVMEFRGVPYRERLPAGTLIVTSGLGGVFPRGIPLGTIEGMLSEAEGWERTYLVRPAAHPAQVTHVLVLKPGAFSDTLAAAFRAPAAADTATAPADSS